MSEVRACAVQMVSTFDVDANLRSAERLIGRAAEAGAKMVVLPENFAVLDSDNLFKWGEAEKTQGIFSGFLSQQSAHHGVWIVGGTIPCRTRPDGSLVSDKRVNATSLVFNAAGEQVGRYDKIHLFDVSVQDNQGEYKESRVIEPGNALSVVDSPLGKLGLTVCYDLWFAGLYSALSEKGCDAFTIPSAFTARTGSAHWEMLVRARAIENQAFVIAPNQGGQHTLKRETWGQSMIVDPWGAVLSQLESGPGIVVADLDFEWQREVRAAMPVQQHQCFRAIVKK